MLSSFRESEMLGEVYSFGLFCNFAWPNGGSNRMTFLKNNVLISLFCILGLQVYSQDDANTKSLRTIQNDSKEYLLLLEKTGDSVRSVSRYASVEYYEFLIEKYKDRGSSSSLERVLDKLTSTYEDLYDYNNSLVYAFDLLNLAYALNDTLLIGQTHSRIATLYSFKSDFDEAIYHFEAAMKIAKQLDSKVGMAAINNNIAGVFFKKGEKERAFESLRNALSMNLKSGNEYWQGINYMQFGDFHSDLNELDSSYIYLVKAKVLFDKHGGLIDSIDINRKFGIYHLKKNDYLRSEMFFKTALSLSEDLGSLKLRATHSFWLSECYDGQGNTSLALEFFKSGHDLEDSLRSLQRIDYTSSLKLNNKFRLLKSAYSRSVEQSEAMKQNLLRKKQDLVFSWTVIIILAISGVIVLLLLRRQLVANRTLMKLNMRGLSNDKEKYSESNLSEELRRELYSRFVAIMEVDRLFLDPDLRLDDVAEKLETSRSYLSQVINELFNDNFNSVVNGYRIELAKQYLIDTSYDKYTLRGISELVGFRSFSVFNSSFRKITGLTPGYFRNHRRVV